MNRGRVAGDHNESGAPFDEVIGDFEDTFVDHLRRLVPVRAPGRVAHVVDWHSGEKPVNLPQHRKSSDPGIEDPDFHWRFCWGISHLV